MEEPVRDRVKRFNNLRGVYLRFGRRCIATLPLGGSSLGEGRVYIDLRDINYL